MLPPGLNMPWTPLPMALCIYTSLSLFSKHFTKNRNSSSISWGSQHHWDLLPAQPAAWQSREQHGHLSYEKCWEESTGNGPGCCSEALLFYALHQWWSWLKIQYPDPATWEKSSDEPSTSKFLKKGTEQLVPVLYLGPPWSSAKVQPLCLGWNFLTKWTNTTYEMDKITHRAFKEEQPNLLLWKKPSL